MSPDDDPHEAPRVVPGAVSPRASSWSIARVFGAWLVGASVVSGAALALQTGYALSAFNAESRLAGLLAVSSLRVIAAQVAAAACCVALLWATHRRDGAQRRLWRICGLVPLTAPVAAGVVMAVGVGVASLGYGVSARASWQSIREIATLDDALFGLALASALAIVLGALAALLEPRLSAWRAGLFTRVVVALLATGLINGAVQGAMDALHPGGDDAGAP